MESSGLLLKIRPVFCLFVWFVFYIILHQFVSIMFNSCGRSMTALPFHSLVPFSSTSSSLLSPFHILTSNIHYMYAPQRTWCLGQNVCVRLVSLGNIAKVVRVFVTVLPAWTEDNVRRKMEGPSPATVRRDIQESSVRLDTLQNQKHHTCWYTNWICAVEVERLIWSHLHYEKHYEPSQV